MKDFSCHMRVSCFKKNWFVLGWEHSKEAWMERSLGEHLGVEMPPVLVSFGHAVDGQESARGEQPTPGVHTPQMLQGLEHRLV